MPHPDEGMIHELLDGELNADQSTALLSHLDQCADCRRLHDEARGLLAEADGVIASLDDAPDRGAAPAEEEDRMPAPAAKSVGVGAPLVLIPEGTGGMRWRRIRPRSYLWAASLVAAAGIGYMLLAMPPRSGPVTEEVAASPDQRDSATTATAEPAGAGELAAAAPKPVTARRHDSVLPQRELAAAPRKDAPASNRTAAKATAPNARRAASEVAPPPAAALNAGAASDAASEQARAPAEPSLAARAQLRTRIGLDEAKRQLGSALHGIDGLRAAMVGLVPGSDVPGADPSRDVVRAVYVDAAGRPFFLDQQRIAPGAPTAGRAGIVRGDVQIILHGGVPADSLRALEPRVR